MTIDHRQRPVVTHTGIMLFAFSGKERKSLKRATKARYHTLTMEERIETDKAL